MMSISNYKGALDGSLQASAQVSLKDLLHTNIPHHHVYNSINVAPTISNSPSGMNKS